MPLSGWPHYDAATPTRVYGHRGACAEFPENSDAAFARAIAVGVDAIESDIRVSRDGVPFLFHDRSAARTAGDDRTMDSMTAGEIDALRLKPEGRSVETGAEYPIPRLLETLKRYPTVPFNLDVKIHREAALQPIFEAIREADAEDRVLLASFSSPLLATIRKRGYRGPTSMGRWDLGQLAFLPRAVLRHRVAAQRAQVPQRAGPLRFASPGFVGKCHALRIAVDFWTINEPAQAERLVALGADGIMTDDPETLVPVVRAALQASGASRDSQ